MQSINRGIIGIGAILAALALPGTGASAFEFNFKGSSAQGHDRYVPPIANPLFNETPYITTEIRPIYLYQDIPSDFLTGGGSIEVVAAEVRIALTERLGFIASKDGYADIDFDGVLPDESGLANISLGFKYAVISNPARDQILTVGAEYEPPTGDLITGGIRLQGNGDGFLDLFATGVQASGRWGFQGSAGYNIAIDGDHDSSMVHYSVHVDYEATPRIYPMVELNGFSVVDDGSRIPVDFEGTDLVNLGATDAGTVITAAGGARFMLNDNVMFGAAYEQPITDREDLMDWRIYVDAVIRY